MKVARSLIRSRLSRTIDSNQSLRYLSTQRTFASYADEYTSKEGLNFKFSQDQFKLHRLDDLDGPKLETYVTKEELKQMYLDMFTIRRMELLCDQYYKNKQIWGFCHLYDGQEAVCVGIENALKKGDHIITAYREHGWQYTRGDTVRGIFAEMFGKKTGCARGKGGSMHLYFPENNFYGGNGIVGAQVPLGTGIALASKQKGDGSCVVTAFGDGAANQGQVYESFNMAKLWKLPIIYLCENNRYGMGTSVERAAAVTDFYTRGDYIPGIAVDGMDVLAVREATRFCGWYTRNVGPIVLEALTYRYHGHSMSDPGVSYRTPDEVAEIRQQYDPLRKVRSWVIDNDIMSEADAKKIEKDIRKQIEADAKDALNDGELDESELVLDIYTTGPPNFVRYSDYDESIVNGKTAIKDM
eukprot:CAMPEP_0201576160 /NCGR_PEP_ID=MMETSP0190_2-20130828/21798_1 /ASSEMBLY_ACC=CAM_ASM_000263 /TAXON_ID=37353 /ORGANISM="Rosalina sp." /LENGTH=411 /DNA_ID=CAMNT_0048006689 /DNA_START=39 /DNA_END=1274 /DNA_ORIENTATION=-